MGETLPTASSSMPVPRLDDLWQLASFTPNDALREAIVHTGSPHCLPAGPKSGQSPPLLGRMARRFAISSLTPSTGIVMEAGVEFWIGTGRSLHSGE